MLGPKYPNQQLRAVSLETFFPGRLGAYAVLGKIQDAVTDRFDNLFVPNVQPGEALALRPFQFRDAAQKRSLAVAVNQATYISFEYPGVKTFMPEALSVLRSALELLTPSSLTRVTFRYENELGAPRQSDGTFPAVERLFPGVLPGSVGASCTALDTKIEVRWAREPSVRGSVGHHARIDQESGLDLVRVTVFATVDAPELTELDAAAELAHDVAFAHFEKIISDEYRAFISTPQQGDSP